MPTLSNLAHIIGMDTIRVLDSIIKVLCSLKNVQTLLAPIFFPSIWHPGNDIFVSSNSLQLDNDYSIIL